MPVAPFLRPQTTARRGQFAATVAANVPLCREHYRLVLRLASFSDTEPGQFVQLSGRDLDADYNVDTEHEWHDGRPPRFSGTDLAAPLAFLRRPFSIAGRRDLAAADGGGVELDFIHRVVGVATDWLARLRPGDRAYLLGPLGNRFTLPDEAPSEGLAFLVGGGVGIPPMLYLAQRLHALRPGRKAVAFAGALSRDLLPFTLTSDAPAADDITPRQSVAEFARHNIPCVLTTDDGSQGFRGYVTQALECALDTWPAVARAKDQCVIYTCGPEPMMRRVADLALARGIACQVAVERAMACGMGTCQSCCIRVRKPDPARPPLAGRDWAWRLACTDGPVFIAAELLW